MIYTLTGQIYFNLMLLFWKKKKKYDVDRVRIRMYFALFFFCHLYSSFRSLSIHNTNSYFHANDFAFGHWWARMFIKMMFVDNFFFWSLGLYLERQYTLTTVTTVAFIYKHFAQTNLTPTLDDDERANKCFFWTFKNIKLNFRLGFFFFIFVCVLCC